jgi:SWI/SNF-related matrix-associated actin-dependent regulator 1 of chromatin subfamily A
MITLYEYQQKAVEFAIEHPYSICALEQGLGKTIVALETAKRVGASNILVIPPAFLRQNWQSEIENLYSCLASRIKIAPYSQLKNLESSHPFDFIICDEAHYLKNPKAKRTEYFHHILRESNPKNLMLLTGTPVKNRIPDIWSLIYFCSFAKKFSFSDSYTGFCRKYCFEVPFSANGYTFRRFEGMKKDKLPELKELLSHCYYRKRLRDVELELPRQVYKPVIMKNKNKHDKALAEAFEMFEVSREDAAFATAKAANALAKIDTTVKQAKEIIESGNQVIIYTDHVAACKALSDEFKVRGITGATPIDQRNNIVGLFKDRKIDVFIATIGSMSTGLNLTNCSHIIFNDFSWVPSDLDQAEKRIHRVGQSSTCFYYYIFSSSVDQIIYNKVQSKREDAEAIE